MIKHIYYNARKKKFIKTIKLTKGEQYDLMKRNNATLKIAHEDDAIIKKYKELIDATYSYL